MNTKEFIAELFMSFIVLFALALALIVGVFLV